MRLLLIEDNEDDACLIREALAERAGNGIELEWADRLEAGLARLGEGAFDAVLLDLSLPGSQGLHTFELAHGRMPDVPIVVLSGFEDERTAVQAVQRGAQDYVVKRGLDADQLVRALRYAIERARTELRLRQAAERLRALTRHLETVREEERTRIARELHDVLGQMLTGLRMDVSWLAKRLDDRTQLADPAPLLARTASMNHLIDETVVALRRLISELRPAVLDHLGLVAALRWQAEEFHRRTGVACDFVCPLEAVGLEADGTTALFRATQEALTNVARHAGATYVVIRLEEDAGQLRLTVEDNGKGITDQQAAGRSSFGILGIRERIALLGGTVALHGTPGRQTTLTVRLPLSTLKETV